MMMIVIVVIMIVIAMCMIVMMRVGPLVGGGIEPGARIGLGVGRIEPLGAQEPDVEGGIVDARNLRRRIEAAQPRGQRGFSFLQRAPDRPDRAW